MKRALLCFQRQQVQGLCIWFIKLWVFLWAAFGIGNANSRDHGGDENVSLADYYTHIELIKELIAKLWVMSLLIWKYWYHLYAETPHYQAVKDVSIQIEKGDIYGIVGYSGGW